MLLDAQAQLQFLEEQGELAEDGLEELAQPKQEEVAETEEGTEEDSYYVEAVVVIANNSTLLKVEINPYMMGDRPVVAFPWDVVPSRFWGSGVCE